MDPIERHSAGAIVIHKGPFSELEVPAIMTVPPIELRERWVIPLYMKFFDPASEQVVATLWPEMNREIAHTLLSYFNWRPRIVGAYIVAIRRIEELTELVGRLLLRSDVCDAGRGYCVALAQLNSARSRQFLCEYLDYYLTRPELWFDQASAMGALAYLDKINGTNDIQIYLPRWDAFVKNKPYWNLTNNCIAFSEQMARLNYLVKKCGG